MVEVIKVSVWNMHRCGNSNLNVKKKQQKIKKKKKQLEEEEEEEPQPGREKTSILSASQLSNRRASGTQAKNFWKRKRF